MSEDLSNTVNRLVDLSKQISAAKEDIKVLVAAERALKEQVKLSMLEKKIDVVNLRKGKISIKKSVRKQGMNKKTVTEGLSNFFQNNEQQLEAALNAIVDCCETRENTTLSMTGLKEKKETE